MQPNQVEIDEALAASLLYDDPESIIYDEVTARQIQQREEGKPFVRFCYNKHTYIWCFLFSANLDLI